MMITNDTLIWLAPVAGAAVMTLTSVVTGYFDTHRSQWANPATDAEANSIVERIRMATNMSGGGPASNEPARRAMYEVSEAERKLRQAAREVLVGADMIRGVIVHNEAPRETPEPPPTRPRAR